MKDPIDLLGARHALAQNTRRFRVRAGLTLKATADRAGLCLRHVQKIEAGAANVTVETLVRLAAALEVSIGALFKRTSATPALPLRPRGRPVAARAGRGASRR